MADKGAGMIEKPERMGKGHIRKKEDNTGKGKSSLSKFCQIHKILPGINFLKISVQGPYRERTEKQLSKTVCEGSMPAEGGQTSF